MRPRQVLPGRSFFVTRRCTQRQFLLRPDDQVNQAIKYCLAEAAERFGIPHGTYQLRVLGLVRVEPPSA